MRVAGVLALIGVVVALLWARSCADVTEPAPVVRAPSTIAVPLQPNPSARAAPQRAAAPAAPADAPPVAVAKRWITGRVSNADGTPAARAFVWLDTEVPTIPMARLRGAEGRYRLEATVGRHRVAAHGAGTGTVWADLDVPAGTDDVEAPALVLSPGLSIRGRVLDLDGKPLPSVRVRCWREDDNVIDALDGGERVQIGQDDVLTDAEGAFVLAGLDDVAHRVQPILGQAVAWQPASSELRAEPEKVEHRRPGGEDLVFRVLPRRTLAGRVLDRRTRKPVVDFEVSFETTTRRLRSADGRFRVALPAEGEVIVNARGHLGWVHAGFTDDELSREVEIALEPDLDVGTLVVVVSDPEGRPAAGLTARVSDSEYRTSEEAVGAEPLRVPGVHAGPVTVSVWGDGWTHAEGTVEVPRASEGTLRLTVRRCGTVRIRVLGPDGRVLRHAPARLVDAAGADVHWRFVFTRTQGTAMPITEWWATGQTSLSEFDGRIAGVAPGPYVLRVGDGERTRDVAIEIPESGETSVEAK